MRWIDDYIPMMSEITREWYLDIKDKITSDRQYFRVSPDANCRLYDVGAYNPKLQD